MTLQSVFTGLTFLVTIHLHFTFPNLTQSLKNTCNSKGKLPTATDFAVSKAHIVITPVIEKESGTHGKKIEQKIAFFLHTILHSCVEENWECGFKLPGRVEHALWTTVQKHTFTALGSCKTLCLWCSGSFCLCIPCFLLQGIEQLIPYNYLGVFTGSLNFQCKHIPNF